MSSLAAMMLIAQQQQGAISAFASMPVMPSLSEDEPPFSRVFVECSSTYSKDMLQQQFQQFGNVQFVWPISDPKTKAFRGMAFIKFDRASSAAFAVENLHNVQLDEGAPLKVTFAMPKNQPQVPFEDGENPPRSRLFVTFHKTVTEEEVHQRFSQFGDLESVKFMKSQETGESRGIAYVKFSKTSSAFRAMEEIEEQEQLQQTPLQPWRCKLATAQSRTGASTTSAPLIAPMHKMGVMIPRQPHVAPMPPRLHSLTMTATEMPGENNMWKNPLCVGRISNNTPPNSRVWFSLSKKVPVDYLQALFSKYGFLESVHLMKGRNVGYAKYNTAMSAVQAVTSINGMEIAEGVVAKADIAAPQIEGVTDPVVKRIRLA
jgi:hypothetical protein